MPPEKAAYALARYSRSPDSIAQSIDWVRTHDSRKFLDSFYFQYGHASIADLGHVTLCFEGISELAATEVEDEVLWDGQARSSRYQDFSKSGFVTPPELTGSDAERYQAAGARLLEAYGKIHAKMIEHLEERLPKPADMKLDAYQRNIGARAFDVARYVLFFGIPTGVGQVTSIRTLERQIRRLKASQYLELRELGGEMAQACSEPPACAWSEADAAEPVAPTLAKYVDADQHAAASHADLVAWASGNLPAKVGGEATMVDVLKPADTHSDVVATLLFPATNWSFRELYELVAGWSAERRNEVIDVALRSRERRDELLRGFRGAPYSFDIVMDIGAYRDLHRHRRCHQFRQAYSGHFGFDTPEALRESGDADWYGNLMRDTLALVDSLPAPAGQYLLPFGARSRFLFKMDFAEAHYISRLRSGVKGHFSYRQVAWEMKEKLGQLEPELGRLLEATPPSVEDPLTR